MTHSSSSTKTSWSDLTGIDPAISAAYRKKMLPASAGLRDNADRLGRLIRRRKPPSSTKSSAQRIATRAGEWRKDPEMLTDEELMVACVELEALIQKQRTENDQAREELEILGPAVRRLDIEKQFVYIELMSEETGLLATDGWRRPKNPARPCRFAP
jgi:hypothetical protein